MVHAYEPTGQLLSVLLTSPARLSLRTIFSTSALLIWPTGRSPRVGKAYVSRLPDHWEEYLALRHVAFRKSITLAVASTKVGIDRRRLWANGSPPARVSFLLARAAFHAPANDTAG